MIFNKCDGFNTKVTGGKSKEKTNSRENPQTSVDCVERSSEGTKFTKENGIYSADNICIDDRF